MEDVVSSTDPTYVTRILISILDGPVFYDYFLEQNAAIANGSSHGYQLNFDTLGVSLPTNIPPPRKLLPIRDRSEMVSSIITPKHHTTQSSQ
jgi:hypothetical protein